MRCLADNILVGLPQNIRILHVAQLQVLSDTETVLSEVLAADKPSMDTLREAKGGISSRIIFLHAHFLIVPSLSF